MYQNPKSRAEDEERDWPSLFFQDHRRRSDGIFDKLQEDYPYASLGDVWPTGSDDASLGDISPTGSDDDEKKDTSKRHEHHLPPNPEKQLSKKIEADLKSSGRRASQRSSKPFTPKVITPVTTWWKALPTEEESSRRERIRNAYRSRIVKKKVAEEIVLYYNRIVAPEFSSFVKANLLQELDLSYTNIKSLTDSISTLVQLRKLVLKRCQLFMELPPLIGQLSNLEVLDLDETKILYLPQEVGSLSRLSFLRVSFYGYKNCGKKLRQNSIIHPGIISNLSQLAALRIDVSPDDECWDAVVGYVIEEACSLKDLLSLTLYVPNVEILGNLSRKTSFGYLTLIKFRITVGRHKQRVISRVPKKVEVQFQERYKCFKFVKGKDITGQINWLLNYTTAFYLDRHATATSLSDFGFENIQKLEFCLMEECNRIETIIDGGESSELPRLLCRLQYLHIYRLKNLVTIWRNQLPDQSLSRLKFLALHKCPKLSVIFSAPLLASLNQLEVLIIEDCSQVTSVVTLSSDVPALSYYLGDIHFLPKLKTLVLLWLPNLASISSGLSIAANLENIGVYDCPKLESLSTKELSSDSLKVVKGEKKWWEALKWDESEWESNKVDHLRNIFSPTQRERDVMSQMEEMWESPSREQTN